MLELRVLWGAQAGARLAVSTGSYRLGRGTQCDIMLAGEGLEADGLLLHLAETITVLPSQPGCGLLPHEEIATPFTVAIGQPFHIGSVWLCVDAQDAPWPLGQPWLASLHEQVAAQNRAQTTTPRRARGWRRRSARMVMTGTILLTSMATVAYALKPDSSHKAGPLRASEEGVVKVVAGQDESVSVEKPVVAASAVEPAGLQTPMPVTEGPREEAAVVLPTVQQAWEVLQARLDESHLRDLVNLTLQNDSLQMTAELDKQEQARLEAILVPFVKEFGNVLSVNAAITPREVQLPFRVTQVVAGKLPHIVTDDGVRIFEGGRYRNYRLVKVTERHIVLAGKQTVELEW